MHHGIRRLEQLARVWGLHDPAPRGDHHRLAPSKRSCKSAQLQRAELLLPVDGEDLRHRATVALFDDAVGVQP